MDSQQCIFCQIVSGQTAADIVWQDDETIFFRDISPQAKVHLVGIPKDHVESLAVLSEQDQGMIGRTIENITKVARQAGIDEGGYRVVTNVGADAGQEVKHLHWHILGGEPLGPIKC